MLRSLLVLALIVGPPAPQGAPGVSGGAALAAASSSFHEQFRTAYASALWTMMVLRWCDRRWARPKETAVAEARLRTINARAVRRGLKRHMVQAGRDNAAMMATMRLDVHCIGGFAPFHARADRALTRVERLLRSRQNS